MTESTIKEINSQGRVSIPAKWRREWKSRKLVLIKRDDEKIELFPLEDARPLSDFFDSIKVSGDADFTDTHSLKRVALELKLREKV